MSSSTPPAVPVPDSPVPRRVRWKLGLTILIVGLALQAAAWFGAPDRTLQIFSVWIIAPTLVFALVLWWTFFSRLARRTKIVGWVALAAAVGLFFALFRHDGYRGAMEPIFTFRWSESPEERAAAFWRNQPTQPVVADGEGLPAEPLEVDEDDWPRFRGSRGDGVIRDVSIRRDWKANPPKLVWKHPVGLGWSSFAIVDRYLYTLEQRDELEAVVCYDAETGGQIWVHTDETRLSTSLGGDGPRSTPTVFDSKVYALGGTGMLNCLEARSGRKVWSTNVLDDAGAAGQWIDWGLAGSPLIVDDLVVVNTGIKHDGGPASLAAYNRTTGRRVWLGGTKQASYVTPTLVELDGVRQIVTVDATDLGGYDPQTGEQLWRTDWTNTQNIHCCMPIVLDDGTLFVSSGYATGSARFQIARNDGAWTVERLERTRNQFKLKFNDGIYHKGHIFGLDEGILSCIDAETLKRKWKKGRYEYGQVLLFEQDDLLLIQAEDGTLHLVPADLTSPQEVASFKALDGVCWNQPAFSRGRIYVRSEREAACYDLSAAEDESE